MSDTDSKNNMKYDGWSVIIWSTVTAVAVVVLALVVWKYALAPLQTGAPTQPQVSSPADLTAIRRNEDSVLSTYQLLGDGSETCRIPIERAMELIAVESVTPTR